MHVLVTYATAEGSTAGVAERIASRLSERGHEAEMHPVDQVDGVDPYDAVVIGSAVHDQAWLPAALAFVHNHATALAQRPVWVFSVGMVDAFPRPLRRGADAEEAKILDAMGDDLSPTGDHIFSGVVERDQFPPMGRAVFRLLGVRYGDHRDWAAIDRWANEIGDQLRPDQKQ
jgi:menaquinone-dependent protoporphyrinogen oxidase